MKAPAFDYAKPASLAAVFALMAEHGDEARLLAGGQTLMATLNMRLSEPALLIDINAVADLKGIAVHNGMLRIGALVTHTEIEGSALIAAHAPLLARAAPHIAHRAIRNLGTFGGSIAYADPSAEWPACLMALDGVVVVRSAIAERRIAAKDFFLDLYTTALKLDELIVACDVPLCQATDAFAFDELARRHGDYAIVGLAVAAGRVPGGLTRLRLAYLGMGTTPLRARQTEDRFSHQVLTSARLDEAVAALQAELNPLADLTHSAATKRHLAGVLARRLLGSLLENT